MKIPCSDSLARSRTLAFQELFLFFLRKEKKNLGKRKETMESTRTLEVSR